MDAAEFRKFGRAAIDFIADYLETIRERCDLWVLKCHRSDLDKVYKKEGTLRLYKNYKICSDHFQASDFKIPRLYSQGPVLPSVEPGYLQNLVPSQAPQTPEQWEDIMKDLDRVIVPGMTHWQSPNFHAYYPTATSYPSIVGEMLSAGFACVGFSWIASPACTELEVVMMDWLGKMLDLPKEFLNCSQGPGGGVIQGSASEATLVALLAAKERTVKRLRALHPDWEEGNIKARLVAYTSDQSNSSVEKAGLLGSMTMRLLPTDDKCRLRGSALENAIQNDLEKGLIPCYVVATLGTTPTCSFDCLEELGPICQRENLWLHVDAAYAGSAFICPEFRHFMAGVQFADSFNFNPHKWMLVNFDCSALWVKDARHLVEAFNVERVYLAHQNEGKAPDYRHWQIPLGRRFRALKLWLVMRTYGVEGLRKHIRHHVALAQQFASMVRADPRFEITSDVSLGLVCFRLKGPNALTKELLDRVTARRQIYVISGIVRDVLVIRFAVCSSSTQSQDLDFAWQEICKCIPSTHESINGEQKNVEPCKESASSASKYKTKENSTTNGLVSHINGILPPSNGCLSQCNV